MSTSLLVDIDPRQHVFLPSPLAESTKQCTSRDQAPPFNGVLLMGIIKKCPALPRWCRVLIAVIDWPVMLDNNVSILENLCIRNVGKIIVGLNVTVKLRKIIRVFTSSKQKFWYMLYYTCIWVWRSGHCVVWWCQFPVKLSPSVQQTWTCCIIAASLYL